MLNVDSPKQLVKDYTSAMHGLDLGISPSRAAQARVQVEFLSRFTKGYYAGLGKSDELRKIQDESRDQLDNKQHQFKTKEDFARAYRQDILSDPSVDGYSKQLNNFLAVHDTSDFPNWFRNCKRNRLRDPKEACPTNFRAYTRVITKDDCETIIPLEFDIKGGLRKRTENQKVRYRTVQQVEGLSYGMTVSDDAVAFSWEMVHCDKIGGIAQLIEDWGKEVGKIEFDTVGQAIADGLAATPLVSNPGGGPLNYDVLREALQTINCAEDNDCCNLDTIIFGNGERWNVEELLSRDFIDFNNGQRNFYKSLGTIHEPRLDAFLNGDYILVDSRDVWLEMAVMPQFLGGPILLFKDTDVEGTDAWGSFPTMSFDMKYIWVGGAGVIRTDCVRRIQGQGPCT